MGICRRGGCGLHVPEDALLGAEALAPPAQGISSIHKVISYRYIESGWEAADVISAPIEHS